jgi:hypothetical protein
LPADTLAALAGAVRKYVGTLLGIVEFAGRLEDVSLKVHADIRGLI